MIDWFERLLLAFIPLFVAIDPVGVVPMFLSITRGIGGARLKTIVHQATATAAVVCVGFMFLGKIVFQALGISVADFQIAGGLILLGFAAKDLLGMGGSQAQGLVQEDVAVVPLGMPLIAGPATIAALLALMDTVGLGPTLVALAVNLILINLSFRYSQQLTRLIGVAGMTAVAKIVGLLLAAIAVNMIRRGIEMR